MWMSSLGKLNVMLVLGKQTLFFSHLYDCLIIVNSKMQRHHHHHYHHNLKQVKICNFALEGLSIVLPT